MKSYPHLLARVFDTPLFIDKPKLEVILSVLNNELGLGIEVGQIDAADIKNRDRSRAYHVTADGIAQIPIHGTLVRRAHALDALSGIRSYEQIRNEVQDAATDPQVRGILLDIDSPGGEASGMFDLMADLREAADMKPVYAAANDDALSAAYGIASVAKQIFVTRTVSAGSVGVIAVHLDESGANEQAGKKYTVMRAGARKAEHNSLEPLTEEGRESLQEELDRLHTLFIDEVAESRNLDPKQVRKTEAQVYHAENAVTAGLADQVGTLEDAHKALVQELEDAVLSINGEETDDDTPGEDSKPERGSDTATTTSLEEAEMETTDGADVAAMELTAEKRARVEKEAVEKERERVARIEHLCGIAGRPDLAKKFAKLGIEPHQVSEKLLELKANEDGVELDTNVGPEGVELGPAVTAEPTVEEQQAKIDVDDIYSRLRKA